VETFSISKGSTKSIVQNLISKNIKDPPRIKGRPFPSKILTTENLIIKLMITIFNKILKIFEGNLVRDLLLQSKYLVKTLVGMKNRN